MEEGSGVVWRVVGDGVWQAIRRKKFSIFASKINVVIGSKSLDFHATSKGLEFRF